MTIKEKILLMDDDKDFLFATKIILEKGGYEVFMAENGKTGVEMWKSINPDLAIIDMMMETWGEGFSVLHKIRSTDKGKEMPIFILTSVDLKGPFTFEPLPECLKVNKVLQKPIKGEDLLNYIAHELGSRRP